MLRLPLRFASALVGAATAVVLGGCTPFALSPPARTLPLESPAALEEGQIAVQVSGGGFDTGDVDGGGASVAARIGMVSLLEVQLEATYAYVDYHDERSPHLVAGRAGLKLAPIPHLAFVTGIGVGHHSYGAYGAPDVGVIVGYENPYFVPWAALRGFVSLPIDGQRVLVTQTDSEGEVEEFLLTPPNTAGWQLSTGFRIPIPLGPAAEGRGAERIDLYAGVAAGTIYALDSDDRETIFQLQGGIEIVLAP